MLCSAFKGFERILDLLDPRNQDLSEPRKRAAEAAGPAGKEERAEEFSMAVTADVALKK